VNNTDGNYFKSGRGVRQGGPDKASFAASFRDVLLSGGTLAAAASSQPAVVKAPRPPKAISWARPRPVREVKGPDAGGWQRYESHRARKQRLKELRCPRRPVPVDLWGRCFNCFSTSHRAAACQEGPRCFKCHGLGHRASFCAERRRALPSAAPRRLVWRPKGSNGGSSPRSVMTPAAAFGGEGAGVVDAPGTQHRRQRRRIRKRRHSGVAGQDCPPGQEGDDNGEFPQAVADNGGPPVPSADLPARHR